MRTTLALAVLSIILFAAAAVLPQDRAPLRIEGRDQYDQELQTDRYLDRPLLTLWGDRKGSEFMLEWSRALDDSLSGLGTLARLDVAHVQGAPFFVKGRIRHRFRNDWSDPVWLDWKGRFQKAYGCPADSCSLLLFDRHGTLLRRWTVAGLDPDRLPAILATARALAREPH